METVTENVCVCVRERERGGGGVAAESNKVSAIKLDYKTVCKMHFSIYVMVKR